MMMDEGIEEELRIIEERARASRSRVPFEEPLSTLCKHPARAVGVGANVSDVIAVLRTSNIGAVVVVGEDGRLVGIVTERDLLRKVIGRPEAEALPVTEIMTADPETLQLDDQIAFVMNKMHVGGFRHVPIVDEDHRPLHVLSIRDVLAAVLDQYPNRVLNIPPAPIRGATDRYGG